MQVAKNEIKSFKINSNFQGILQYYKNSNLLTFDASSSIYNDPISVLDGNKLWQSGYNENAYFSFFIKSMRIQLSSVSLYSCKENECVNNLLIEGKNTNDDWEEICRYTGNYERFRGNNGTFKCFNKSHAYEGFKITMLNENSDGTWIFAIRYLEIFGSIFPNNFTIVFNSIHHLEYTVFSLFLYFIII